MSSVFYYTRESIENFQTKRQLALMGQEDKILSAEELEQQNKTELYKDCITYESDMCFIGYPILEDDVLRPATLIELIDLGEQQLMAGEIINREAGTIEKIEQPTWQYKWDFELLKWLPDESTIQVGQYIEGEIIIEVPYDENLEYVNPFWDKETHTWIEKATETEKKSLYYSKINEMKTAILDNGFDFNGHQQKCREKDIALLGNAIESLNDMKTFNQLTEDGKINWSFNDGDIVEMSETDLRIMRMSGASFINTVYGVEAELKKEEVNLKLEISEFIKRIDILSEVKCYKFK